MKKILNRCLEPKTVKAIIIGLLVFTVSFITMGKAFAETGPVFNNSQYDYQLIRVAKTPAGSNDFQSSAKAKDGDTIAVMLYYHNNTQNTVAKNTSLKVALPTDESKNHVLTADLWAENASHVGGTASITSDAKTTLTYVAGSTLWYPDRNQHPNDAGIATADGVAGAGVNIHDITGCWEYAGFVSFKVKVKTVATPPTKPEEPKIEVIQEQRIEIVKGVSSMPKTGSPVAEFSALSGVLSGLCVSGYYYLASKKGLAAIIGR